MARIAPNMPASGLWRRMPPAVFPPIMGLFALGLGWRAGAGAFGLPAGVGDLILGAVSLLYAFAAIAWLSKPLRRPAVVLEELRTLPGRAGLAALTLSLMLLALTLAPHAPGLGRALAFGGIAAHAVLGCVLVWVMLSGPPEGRAVTPIWHLHFVGFIIGAMALVPLGHPGAAAAILTVTVPVALAIWGFSLWQLARRVPPAPLRPLLAVHLAPAALFATVAAQLGLPVQAAGFAIFGALILLALALAMRWIVAAGFTPLWGAFTFPLAAYAGALLSLGAGAPEAVRLTGGVVLVAATLIVPPIAVFVLRGWARGTLAAQTNAATA